MSVMSMLHAAAEEYVELLGAGMPKREAFARVTNGFTDDESEFLAEQLGFAAPPRVVKS